MYSRKDCSNFKPNCILIFLLNWRLMTSKGQAWKRRHTSMTGSRIPMRIKRLTTSATVLVNQELFHLISRTLCFLRISINGQFRTLELHSRSAGTFTSLFWLLGKFLHYITLDWIGRWQISQTLNQITLCNDVDPGTKCSCSQLRTILIVFGLHRWFHG